MTAAAARPGANSPWILGPRRDLAFFVLPVLWIFPLLWFLNDRFDIAVFGGALLAVGSVGHHLPGFIRAYTDPELFRRYRARFIAAPVFFAGVCLAFALLNLHSLTLLLVLWGAWHGAMQVNGFLRIYDAKAGSIDPLTARLDALMCLMWFGGGLLHSSSRMPAFLAMFYGAGGSLIDPRAYFIFRGLWDAGMLLVTVAFVVNAWVRARRGNPPSVLKGLAMLSAFGFWWLAMVGVNNLLLGLVLFEIFHDVQYNAIVWAYNRRRISQGAGSRLERFLFEPGWIRFAVYGALILAYGGLGMAAGYAGTQTGSDPAAAGALTSFWTQVFIVSAFLHFYFDGFIWRIREPGLRRGLGVAETREAPVDETARVSPRVPAFAKWGLLFVLPALALGWREYQNRAVPLRTQYDNMAAILPESWYVNFVLASLENVDRDFSRSIAHYEKAVAEKPDLGMAHAYLGDLYGRQGRLDDAIRHYERAVELGADDFRVRVNLGGLLLSRQRDSEARPHLQAAWEMDSADPALAYRLGTIFMRERNPRGALPYLRRAVELDPGHAQALNALGIAEQTLGNTAEALAHYRLALQADPRYADARQNLAQAEALLPASRR